MWAIIENWQYEKNICKGHVKAAAQDIFKSDLRKKYTSQKTVRYRLWIIR